jgi:hypothetical protein
MKEFADQAPAVFRQEDMISVGRFARSLGVSRRHAYNMVDWGPSNGGVLAFRFGRTRGLRIPKTEVERIKKSSQVEEV